MWKWLPWKYFVRRLVRKHGLLDPFNLLARLDRIGQPAEVRAPFELIRAGVAFHARGMMNARVIQNNLDWQWPYWVRRQFDPTDKAFLPRGFAISHVNLTHRNWTAVGLPDCEALPVVDPRGMLTPFFDGWSLDAAVVTEDGRHLMPAACPGADQRLELPESGPRVVTETADQGLALSTSAWVEDADGPTCRYLCCATAGVPGWLVLSLRPCNPEGVSFVNTLELVDQRRAWRVDHSTCVRFDAPPDRHEISSYEEGDVFLGLLEREPSDIVECEVGLATAAAMYRLGEDGSAAVGLSVPLSEDPESKPLLPKGTAGTWPSALDGVCRLSVPDGCMQRLYDAALRSLVLHSPSLAYPGPYTYKRFWYRDAAFIAHALLCAGLSDRVEHLLNRFPTNQRGDGYFHSQDGEWDSNGQALWIYRRFCQLAGRAIKESWHQPILSAARWICRKVTDPHGEQRHSGLLPAGFSAEHLGNNDYYYWDDFWAIAGLRAAASMAERWGREPQATRFQAKAHDLMEAVERSLAANPQAEQMGTVPASPYRRMDAGAVGSLAASYPLGLWPPGDTRILNTERWLRSNCFQQGAFFHEVIHSGINAYLTLHIAQVLLRAGDPSFFDLVRSIEKLASATGQWPEAIHPRTGGGCMGDGQHVWAAAEWVLMMRNMFVREEGDRLILASGVPECWGAEDGAADCGPAPTPWGPVWVSVSGGPSSPEVSWRGDWRVEPPCIEVRLPGCRALTFRGQASGTARPPNRTSERDEA